jgi:hypothetical protein
MQHALANAAQIILTGFGFLHVTSGRVPSAPADILFLIF